MIDVKTVVHDLRDRKIKLESSYCVTKIASTVLQFNSSTNGREAMPLCAG